MGADITFWGIKCGIWKTGKWRSSATLEFLKEKQLGQTGLLYHALLRTVCKLFKERPERDRKHEPIRHLNNWWWTYWEYTENLCLIVILHFILFRMPSYLCYLILVFLAQQTQLFSSLVYGLSLPLKYQVLESRYLFSAIAQHLDQ